MRQVCASALCMALPGQRSTCHDRTVQYSGTCRHVRLYYYSNIYIVIEYTRIYRNIEIYTVYHLYAVRYWLMSIYYVYLYRIMK